MLRPIVRSFHPDGIAILVTRTWAFAGSLAIAACGAGTYEVQRPARPLPSYTGRSMDLFDDAIEPTSVGYNLGAYVPPDRDPLLRERAQLGDAVVRARVSTVTSRDERSTRSWQVGLHTVERVAGAGPLAADFTLNVAPNSGAAGILRAFESRLIGKTFVTFVREFAPPGPAGGGDSELHFHLSHDGTDEVNAVLAAALRIGVR